MASTTRNLPPQYHFVREIDLVKNQKLAVILNIAGLAALVPVIWFLSFYLRAIHAGEIPTGSLSGKTFWTVLLILGVITLTILLHEAIHGVFFWVFTHTRPVFAVKTFYAYAAAPGWYIPSGRYMLIGLSPLVLIDLAALVLLWICPPAWIIPICTAFAMNTSGAVGDLYILATLLRGSPQTLVLDSGDGIRYFEA